jgi:hypothetical protein
MYLDKPLRDHNLLQAIGRTNRPYPNKTHGLIVDYLGIFNDVARGPAFDEQSVKQAISNLDELRAQACCGVGLRRAADGGTSTRKAPWVVGRHLVGGRPHPPASDGAADRHGPGPGPGGALDLE